MIGEKIGVERHKKGRFYCYSELKRAKNAVSEYPLVLATIGVPTAAF